MSDTLKCYECQQAGQTSTVTPHGTRSTLLGGSRGHYDERGEWVRHPDPNWHTTAHTCSLGHAFEVIRKEGEPDRLRLGVRYSGSPCKRQGDIERAAPTVLREGSTNG